MGDSRILFLGTAGDAIVVGKQHRSSGGIIFTYDDNQFHIDPGPGSLLMAKMANVNLRENTAVFVTDNNLFRANDVNAVISAMTHDGLDKRGVLVAPTSVIFEDKNNSPFLNQKYKKYIEKTISIDNTTRLGINNVEIEILKLKQGFGFKFVTPKFNLAYIPDTFYSDELTEFEDIDILILAVKNPGEIEKGSINSENAKIIIKGISPQLAIITGFGVKMLKADPLYETRQIQKSTGIQIIAAKDGMKINPISFGATVRQKNLKTFQ